MRSSHHQNVNNRPKIYTPRQIHFVNLYHLYHDFEFESLLHADVTINPDQDIPRNVEINGFRFCRLDGIKINYFQTIQDKESDVFPYPTLEEWLIGYKKLIFDREISKQDITITTLVQVQYGRKHFNTLVIHSDNENIFHAYIIESRDSNLTLTKSNKFGFIRSLIYYPIEKLGNKIRAILKEVTEEKEEDIIFSNIKTGQQSFYNDKDCGAHHINYTEIISHLSVHVIKDSHYLKDIISNADLSRRNDDNQKIKFIADYQREFEIEKKEQDQSDLLNNLTFNVNLSGKFSDKKSKMIGDVIGIIGQYTDKYKKKNFNLFGGHTRQDTARLMVDALNKINEEKMEEQCDSVNTIKIRKVSVLLYACYYTIERNSEFRHMLGYALAKILNCETEYNAILAEINADKLTCIKNLFVQRLTLLGIFHTISYDHSMKILNAMKRINENDACFSYKCSKSKRQEVDNERFKLFQYINQCIHACERKKSFEQKTLSG